MGNTSYIVLRPARRDGLAGPTGSAGSAGPAGPAGPATQFAELTGAYWMEPIYAGLAKEWSRQGRAVPGTPKGRWRIMPDSPLDPGCRTESA